MNPNPDPVQTPGQPPAPSLYEQTKLTRDGVTLFKRRTAASSYYVRLSLPGGRRVTRKLLRTADESFKVARRLIDEAAAGRFDSLEQTKARTIAYATVETICQHYEAQARAVRGIRERTVTANVNALKHVLRAVHGRETAVEKLSSAVLDGVLLDKFKAAALAAAGKDLLKERTARVTCNSTMRQARSVFAKKLGPDFYASFKLPPSLPKFMAVQFFKVEVRRFRMPDATVLQNIRSYAVLLKKTDPEAYKIYLLALGAGLRKGEIAHARCRWIEQPAGIALATVRVQTETDFHVKDNEERCVPLDPFVLSELGELLSGRKPDDYILTGAVTERTDNVFRRFSAWLKQMGWDRRLKCHEMRKVFGSMATAQAGVRAAQVLLGHASVSTTEGHYSDPALSIAPVQIFAPQKVA